MTTELVFHPDIVANWLLKKLHKSMNPDKKPALTASEINILSQKLEKRLDNYGVMLTPKYLAVLLCRPDLCSNNIYFIRVGTEFWISCTAYHGEIMQTAKDHHQSRGSIISFSLLAQGNQLDGGELEFAQEGYLRLTDLSRTLKSYYVDQFCNQPLFRLISLSVLKLLINEALLLVPANSRFLAIGTSSQIDDNTHYG